VSSSVAAVPLGTVVYGIQLPVQSKSTGFAQPWEMDAGVEHLVRIAQAADRLGFFYVGVCDHVAIPRAAAHAMSTTWYDTIATLGMLAGLTSRVRLLSHVWVLPYRPVLQTINSFATLDHLSGGRVIVGVGAGHLAAEFEALGVDFAARGRLLDDGLPVLLEGLSSEYVGDMGIAPRPVQVPRPPVWVGGMSLPALRRAARWGDGWLPQGTTRAQLPEVIAVLTEARRQFRGDDPIDIGGLTEFLYVGEPSWDIGDGTVHGSPAEVAASLAELVELGVNHLQVRFRARSCEELEDQMEAFATDVAPLLPDT
jgi:probable F420-dependent oxidoreductase